MWWLFLLFIWLLWESTHYAIHHQQVRRWRSHHHLHTSVRDKWNHERQVTIPNKQLHLQLAQRLHIYDQQSVLRPHYKPILYHGLLRGAHETAFAMAKYCGWRCTIHHGVWFWERGTGSTILFLHGFGFGPYAYGRFLNTLSTYYRVVAPQYPGLSYDGRMDIPEIQDYARTITSYLSEERYSIISNSFGTIVHHAILRELSDTANSRIRQQIYVEPVCFYPYAGQLFSFIELSWRTCLTAPTWKASMVAAMSYLLVAKDRSTLYLCQQILQDPRWDGEVHLPHIPSTIILSELDNLIKVPELQEYFNLHYPSVTVVVLPGAYHGEALFSPRLKINTLLFPCTTKE